LDKVQINSNKIMEIFGNKRTPRKGISMKQECTFRVTIEYNRMYISTYTTIMYPQLKANVNVSFGKEDGNLYLLIDKDSELCIKYNIGTGFSITSKPAADIIRKEYGINSDDLIFEIIKVNESKFKLQLVL
jgi:hypothetical protein